MTRNAGDRSTSQFPHSGTQSLPTRRIRVIGVPLDMGASRRGVDMGPSAMRVAGLESRLEALGHQVTDGGNIRVEVAETRTSGDKSARYLSEIAETCSRTAEAVLKTLEEGMTPMVLGGDHSLAAGSVSGVMNMGGQIGGIVTASLTPLIAHQFSWTASFLVAAALCAAGSLAWLAVDPNVELGR